MPDFLDSTLWRISAFEKARLQEVNSQYKLAARQSKLSTTLQAELTKLERIAHNNDVLEVLAACMRHRESALVYLQYGEHVWPITVFARQYMYHSPRELVSTLSEGVTSLPVLSVEPPGVRPPGIGMSDRVAAEAHYHGLLPLLWAMALYGPRESLLEDIGGVASYRIAPDFYLGSLPVRGAIGPAIDRLRREIAPLRTIASWPGMNTERASRLLNALYLLAGLMVLRTHHTARREPAPAPRDWLGWVRTRF